MPLLICAKNNIVDIYICHLWDVINCRIKEPRVNDSEVERGIEKKTERTEEAFKNTGRDIRKRGRM